jgi:PKD repeat protein
LVIHVKSTPIAAYTAPAVCLGDSTKFINLSDSNGYSIVRNYWKFGDSGTGITDTSNLVNPAYKYPRYGKYHSMLVVQNSLGCRDTLKRDVKVYKLPQALFLSPVSCSRQEVFFTDKSKPGDTIITKWNWAFGDPVNNQDSSTQRNPSHKYHQAGKYYTSLMVTDYFACKDTLRDSVNVLESPISAFTYRDNVDGVSGKLQFTNKSENANTYNWDFGNGKTSVEENPEVAYDEDGSYVITLAVTSTNTCEDTSSMKYEFIFHGLYVPNLFAPTDMVYQVRFFKPAGINLASYNITVYDIAGHKLWESSALDDFGRPLEGWDGTVNGNLMPQGTYTWRISAMFKDGKVWEGSNTGKGSTSTMGTVTLVR